MSKYEDFLKRWVFRNEVGNQIVQDLDALIQEKVEEEQDSWGDNIQDDANRAGLDTRGICGMAIVHTMVDTIDGLRKEIEDWKAKT